MHRHTRGERGLDRWASSTSHDSTDRSTPRSLDRVRDSTRRRDSTTRDGHGAARRVERRLRRGPTPGIGGEIARVTEQVRLDRSTDRPVDRSRARRHSPRGIRMETATDGLFAPRRARARRMDRMRRMSASGDGTMSARKQAPSSARRLSRPSAYGACDARWDDDSIRCARDGNGRMSEGAITEGDDARAVDGFLERRARGGRNRRETREANRTEPNRTD